MSGGQVGVVVRVPERAYGRLRAEAHRKGTTVRMLLQGAALAAAEPLPDPLPPVRRTMREVLASRVHDLRAADLTDEQIADQLGIPLERVAGVR